MSTYIINGKIALSLYFILIYFYSYLSTRVNTLTSEDVYGDSAVV
jgi:hypothetical protein